MGMEDRDWYREKEIDWDRGGLRDRNSKRRRFRKYTWWILAAILLIVAVVLLWQS
jgi:predicted nucleic acid-binding Zn ribbon protein